VLLMASWGKAGSTVNLIGWPSLLLRFADVLATVLGEVVARSSAPTG